MKLLYSGKKHKIYSGDKFGRLEVINISGKNKWNKVLLKCLCQCGNKKIIMMSNLINGNTSSCGCLFKEAIQKRTTHNMSNHQLYITWRNMIARCTQKSHICYENYGGRGIKVCKEWMKLENFISDMWGSYKKGLTIDRIDNDGNYEKSNCRWATYKEQANNKNRTLEN